MLYATLTHDQGSAKNVTRICVGSDIQHSTRNTQARARSLALDEHTHKKKNFVGVGRVISKDGTW